MKKAAVLIIFLAVSLSLAAQDLTELGRKLEEYTNKELAQVVSVVLTDNSDIKNIVNRSEHGSVAISTVGISYKLSLEEVEKKIPAILEKIKNRNADVFTGAVVYLGVEDLSDSCVVLKFKAEVDEKNIFAGRRLLNRELKVCFDESGIEIAYPQLDLHMKN